MEVKIVDKTKEVEEEMERKILVALTAVGEQAEGDAKKELESAPRRIDTGYLRNSITYIVSGQNPHIKSYKNNGRSERTGKKVKEKKGEYDGTMGRTEDHEVYVGTNVEYAIEIHEGRKGLTPNRFVKNAIQKNMKTYQAIMRKTLEQS